MPAYSFSVPGFDVKIPKGEKSRTTRVFSQARFDQARKAMEEGRPAALYWKQRTRECRLLLKAPLVEVEIVKIYADSRAEKEGVLMTLAERDTYAQEEGFAGDNNFTAWAYFFGALIRLHGPYFWKNLLYTVKWQLGDTKGRPSEVPSHKVVK